MPTREKYATMTKYRGGGAFKGRSMASRKSHKGQESSRNISDADRSKINKMLGQESGKSISDADRKRVNNMLKGFNGGGEVKGGTSSQISGRHYKGVF